MGRIDEALRRARDESGATPGTAAPVPDSSPWRFEAREDTGATGRPEARGTDLAAEEELAEAGSGPDRRRHGLEDTANERLVVSKLAPGLLVEQFRSLSAALLADRGDQPLKSLLVTSPSPGDGKSHVAVNLALTLSVSYGRRVLLVDADLRRPSLHKIFGLRNGRGLSEALRSRAEGVLPAVPVAGGLMLLPAGRPDPTHLGDLSSERLSRIVAAGTSQFDWVIVDSPPVGLLADARLVAEAVDGTLLVVRAGVTRFPDLDAAADTLGRERILGVVLNAVDPAEIRGEDYYRHYYGPSPGKR